LYRLGSMYINYSVALLSSSCYSGYGLNFSYNNMICLELISSDKYLG
jgi:hypothetical protein